VAEELYVGLMSGTSLDGIDAALVRFQDDMPTCTATHYQSYPDELKQDILALHGTGSDELNRACLVGNRLAQEYAAAVHALLRTAQVDSDAVRALGCHGQTIRHAPRLGYTVQINNPALLAELTGIAVVADFRSRDIAAGGEGAPLVPAFHAAVFRRRDRHRVIANIGGIANLTNLAPGAPTTGFDCGPGNMLLDAWVQRHRGIPYDAGGRWAASGQVLPALRTRLLAHPFFAASPPKSCGREEFGLPWLDSCVGGDEAPEDVQATLVALTARGIADGMRKWCGQAEELFLCGGGAHNQALRSGLATELPGVRIGTTDELGLPADWVEATAFAWLARCRLVGLPGNLPEVTGARGPRVLGALYPP
jgi:anhydro-N-acetylmuramic acid kinase